MSAYILYEEYFNGKCPNCMVVPAMNAERLLTAATEVTIFAYVMDSI